MKNLTPRPGTVLVGYDGSDHAESALRWAADEADLEGRTLTIVNVVQPLVAYELSVLASSWSPPTEIRAAIAKHAAEELESVRARLRQTMPDLDVEVLLREGDPRDVLLDLSRDAAALFVGSRGRGPAKSLVLGSVGVAVSRAASCPVFVIRPYHPGQEHHGVLVGTDCTERSLPTLEYAFRQASLRDLPLTVLHCFGGTPPASGLEAILDDDLAGYEELRLALAESVAGFAEKFPDVAARLRLGHGVPDVCLVDESERMDLVVVGHHEGRAFGDMIRLGSFVAPVVESSTCPVVVVPSVPDQA